MMMNVYAVKRLKTDFNSDRELDKNSPHDRMLRNHFDVLSALGIDFWSTRKKITDLANDTLISANFNHVYSNLDVLDNLSFEQLEGSWVYFTDDDDWVTDTFISDISQYIIDDVECIVWPHIRYHAIDNALIGSILTEGYDPTPKLQSNHCLIKITSDLFFNWEPELPLSEKCQHWNLSNYVYKDEKTERINVRNIDDILSLWNNTILSFSWHMHPDSFSINVLDSLKAVYSSYINEMPKNFDKLNPYLISLIKKQQDIFKQDCPDGLPVMACR